MASTALCTHPLDGRTGKKEADIAIRVHSSRETTKAATSPSAQKIPRS